MADTQEKYKSLLKGAAGYAGLRLIDPIEVYYLPSENSFYPIISKSGCTSIKVMLIRKFNPDFESSFPAIHHINPAIPTKNKVKRLYFKTKNSYAKWTKGKKMFFVMRDPISRLYSCYLDMASGKNIMYQYPSGLDWFYDFRKDLSFDAFLKKVCGIPDRFSDRHFRSQSFYLSDEVRRGLESLEAFTLKEYMSSTSSKDYSNENKSLKLNSNKSSMPEDVKAKVLKDPGFSKRFNADLILFESIANEKY